ncbi:hypothetical protein niasHT_017919 [Heterodera trifolii]
MINTVIASIYMYMQFYGTFQWLNVLATFAWLHVHGLPPVIYLALNKTIRNDCRMLYMKVFKRNRISQISGGLTTDYNPDRRAGPNLAGTASTRR